MILSVLLILGLAFIQTVSFAMVSRARNRDNMWYHAATSASSNGIWYVCMGVLVVSNFSWYLMLPYMIGTVSGSLFGAMVSMKIEKAIGAKT